MVFVVLTSLSLVFVAGGVVLLVVSYRLSRRARVYRAAMQALLLLGSKDVEPMEIPAEAWPALHSGGWKMLLWRGEWFGHPVQGHLGAALAEMTTMRQNPLEFEIESGSDVRLQLRLFHQARRGESRLFAEQLARVFVLVLEARLRSRTEALSVALAGRARLSLYLQHDTRNLAQWVSWVSADFAACTTSESLLAAARRLQENAPLARDRAQRLTAALGKNRELDTPHRINLFQAVTQAARLSGIEPNVTGKADVWMADSLLARALDNLFSNLASGWREAMSRQPALNISQVGARQDRAAHVQLDFFSPWPEKGVRLPPEKLFEPFASGRPGGLGLGLYQARKSLREAGGDLHATASEDGLAFLLQLPAPRA